MSRRLQILPLLFILLLIFSLNIGVIAQDEAEPVVEDPTVEAPTEAPTLTATPTLEPTALPTNTLEPTAEPTLEPTATLEPEVTDEPTAEPTLEITTAPTGEVTEEPLVQPQAPAAAPPIVFAPLNFVVNSTADPGDGVCDPAECTLREAINAANANEDPDTITFNIPGPGTHMIQPAQLLPVITDDVVIDATTQPGYSGTPLIFLDGTNVVTAPIGGLPQEVTAVGFNLMNGSSTIRGFAIGNFAYGGISIVGPSIDYDGSNFPNSFGSSANNLIEANFIGTDITGLETRPNLYGVIIAHSADNTIGGTVAARNVISGNADDGVNIYGAGATGNSVLGNYIGMDALGNGGLGVGNAGDGVRIISGSGNRLQENVISDNGGIGINLDADGDPATLDGVTPNDSGDGDSGANGLQNAPVLTQALLIGANSAKITTFIDSTPETLFRVEYYANSACDASGSGEGRTYLGYGEATTNATGQATFVTQTFGVSLGQFITGTATNLTTNDTSEFSVCAPVVENMLPLADAGDDQNIIDNDNDGVVTVSLDGTRSRDTDGTIVSYNWYDGGSNPIGTGETTTVELDAPGVYILQLIVTDNNGGQDEDFVQITVISPVIVPPVAPSDLTATAVSDTEIDLTWTDNSSDETEFSIERSLTGTDGWTEIGTPAADLTTFSDEGLTCETEYFYRIRAYREGDQQFSEYSSNASATTLDCDLIPPAVPTELTATTVSESEISLSWVDNASDETGYSIERSANGVNGWTQAGTTGPDENAFTDDALICNTQYFYRVRAVRDTAFSEYSNVDSATTAACGPPQTFEVNSTADPGTDGICDVTECTLREAISAANANPALDTISFNITGTAPYTIQPLTALPEITDPVIIDGTTQPGYVDAPIIEVDGTNLAGTESGLFISAGSSTVRGLVINHFPTAGVYLSINGGNVVEGNYIGTDATGTANAENGIASVISDGSANNRVGTNGDGVNDAAERNILVGMVEINNVSGTGTDNNVIAGNYIGLDVTGTSVLATGEMGVVLLNGVQNNRIGTDGNGTADEAERNIIAGHSLAGVYIVGTDVGNTTIAGNYIGTDVTGTVALGNLNGILIENSSTNTVEDNLISGNLGNGLIVSGSDNSITGNLIGTDVTGTLALGNGTSVTSDSYAGITITGSATIGGATEAERNVISANTGFGINATGNITILGNFIGTDVTGTLALGNSGTGIVAHGPVVIGGADAASGNVIAASGDAVNLGSGIALFADGALVQNNLIGTDVTGTVNLGNDVGIYFESANTSILHNTIAYNNYAGIYGYSGIGNRISENAIFANELVGAPPTNWPLEPSGLGIDLTNQVPGVGVSPNDDDDADSGANNLQNFPVLTAAATTNADLTVSGTLNSLPETTFRIEFFANDVCDASDNGEGQMYLGFIEAATDTNGDLSFVEILDDDVEPGQFITATATNLTSNDTSEFSACIEAVIDTSVPAAPTDLIATADSYQQISLTWTDNATDETGYSIERSANGVDGWTEVGTAAADATTFTDDGLTCATEYFYRVRTVRNAAFSEYSNLDSATTAACGTPQTFVVNSTADPGTDDICDVAECTLREAINAANANPAADTISFNIAGTAPFTIQPLTALPEITDPVTIDGTTQPGYVDAPIIEVDGMNLVNNGLFITAGDSTVRGLVINNFELAGIYLSANGGNVVEGNYIGTDVTGTTNAENAVAIEIADGSANNLIGTNGDGVDDAAERNVIVGLVEINNLSGTGTDNNVIAGNYIGLDVTGTTVLASGEMGVTLLNGVQNNRIGTDGNGIADEAERNIIAGHSLAGVYIVGTDVGNTTIAGNYIGTDVTGTVALGNLNGIFLDNSSTNTVEDNLISGNLGNGLIISGSDNVVIGNLIGTDVTGTLALGNASASDDTDTFAGISIEGSGTIGGVTEAERNVISANIGFGINATGNITILGNFIGTDVTGTLPLGNTRAGVLTFGTVTIGESEAGAGNVISANGDDVQSGTGIIIAGNDVTVENNIIGSDVTGTLNLGNDVGISLQGDDNVIVENVIAYNNYVGVTGYSGIGNVISENSIFDNELVGMPPTNWPSIPSGLGIDLTNEDTLIGITPNDADDVDTGSNNLQNFPVLTAAATTGTSLTIDGTLNSTAETTFRIEFFANDACDASGHGEGQTYLGFIEAATDADGDLSFNQALAVTVAEGQFITATATNLTTNDTSEFSACVEAVIDTSVPTAPSELASETASATSIELTWTDNATDETGYSIERSADGVSGWAEIGTAGVDATTFTDDGLTCETEYFYRVRAVRDTAFSEYSNVDSAMTFSCVEILLRKPDDNSALTSTRPRFQWKRNKNAERYQFQLATDDDFEAGDIVLALETNNNRTTTYAVPRGSDLAFGRYYWRVNVDSGSGNFVPASEVFSVIITPSIPKAPRLTAPAKNALLTDATPDFSWQAVSGLAEPYTYEIQIDDDSRFRTPQVSEIVSGLTFTPTVDLPDGRWFWRVRAVNSYGAGGKWSSSSKFTVDVVPPDAPTLRRPGDATHAFNPKFQWNKVATAKRYRIQISDSDTFANLLVDAEIGSTTYRLPKSGPVLELTTYYWRVQAEDVAGNIGDFSAVFSFNNTLPKNPADGSFTTNTRPRFQWNRYSGAVAYQLEVATDPAFDPADIVIDETFTNAKTTSYSVPRGADLPLAIYYWRVNVDTGAGMTESPFYFTLIVSPKPPKAPVLSTPVKNSTVNTATPDFTWQAVTGAGEPFSYEIQIDNDSRFRSVDQSSVEVAPSYTADPLAAGRWFWRVRAVNNLGVPGQWSKGLRFEVILP